MPDNDQPNEFNPSEVEITDLDLPHHVQSRARARLGHLLLRWQRPERRRARLWLSGALLTCFAFALIAALFSPAAGVIALLQAHWPFQPSQIPLSAQNAALSQTFLPDFTEIRCPVQTAWSPNSESIAVLGYTQSCNQSVYVSAQINLYNAATGLQVAHWQPDQAILAALLNSPGVSLNIRALAVRKPGIGARRVGSPPPAIQYLQMLWSPDSTRVAMSFAASTHLMTYEGLFLADVGGSHAQVLFRSEDQQTEQSRSVPLQWDLQRNTVVPLNTLAPALTYTWSARDTLVPLTPLSAQDNLSTYVALPPGNPVGDRTFSIWQPGRPMVLPFTHTTDAYLWSSNFATWSPDGQSVITNMTFTGLIEPPGRTLPTSGELAALNVQNVIHVSDPDPAFIPASANTRTVAWNPTGTLLAAYALNGVVNLYDCNSGRLLHAFKPSQAHPLAGSATLLSWSPDGHSLLLSSAQWGLITLWRVEN
jgi:WD40 repeat protein